MLLFVFCDPCFGEWLFVMVPVCVRGYNKVSPQSGLFKPGSPGITSDPPDESDSFSCSDWSQFWKKILDITNCIETNCGQFIRYAVCEALRGWVCAGVCAVKVLCEKHTDPLWALLWTSHRTSVLSTTEGPQVGRECIHRAPKTLSDSNFRTSSNLNLLAGCEEFQQCSLKCILIPVATRLSFKGLLHPNYK